MTTETHSPIAQVDRWRPSQTRQSVWLVGWLSLCYAAAAAGGMFTASSLGDWYQRLAKPAWTPPDEVFGPVWTILYGMMAVSAWLVWRRGGWPDAWRGLAIFLVQLALNVGWSAVFFALRQPGLAVVQIALLWLAIAATTLTFRRWSRWATLLLLPYLAWTSFAAALNWAIWRLNA